MEKYELTFPQKNIWLVENFYESKLINIISGSLQFNRDFDINMAEKTVNKFVELNDAMRIKICIEDSIPKQYVVPFVTFKADKINVEGKNEEEIEQIKFEYISTPINILDNLLFSYLLIDRGNGKGEIFLKAHHLICDGWSGSKMVTGLAEIYDSLLQNIQEFEPYPSYIDYIKKENEYKSQEKFKEDETFWKQYLLGFNESVSIKGIPCMTTKAKRYSKKLDENLNNLILDYCKENKVSPYSIFMTALAIYLERTTEKNDIVIGTPILNRSNFSEKKMQGMFVSTMPVRFKIDEKKTFKEICAFNARESMSLFRHQRFPFSITTENLKKENGLEENVYSVMVSYQNARATFNKPDTYRMNWNFSKEAQDELAIHIVDLNDDKILETDYDYIEELFNEEEVKRIAERIETIIYEGITSNKSIECIDIMPVEEKRQILQFNNTQSVYPSEKTIIELFEEQVSFVKEKTAIVYKNESISYIKLNERANSIANFLRENGIKQNDVVGIMQAKGINLVASIIAVLKLGAIYVPMDKQATNESINHIITNSGIKTIITDDKNFEINNIQILSLSNMSNNYTFKNYKTCPEDVVNIMYTSGTTGKTKGVQITNKNVIKLVKNSNYIEFKENDVMLQTGSFTFDASTLELWNGLLNGVPLYMVDDELLTPSVFKEYIIKNNITVIFLTAAIFNRMIAFDESMFKNVRVLMTGGEAISKEHAQKVVDSCKNTIVKNLYGPTENAVVSTYYDVSGNEDIIPIGKALSNTTCYVLDSKQRLLPLDVPGYLYVGGAGVSKGYINNEKLTLERFIKTNYEQNRLYNTGDIVCMREDGNILFVGRKDSEVKIKGVRANLDEIKEKVNKFGSIQNNEVLCLKDNNNNKYLAVAFVSDTLEDVDKLKSYLKEYLPNYIIPKKILQVESIPLTVNGKVDKFKLETILSNINCNKEERTIEYTGTYLKIYNLFKDVLEISNIALDDDFFDIGGDSVLGVDLITRAIDKNINITYSDLYKYRTIKELGDLVNSQKEEVSISQDISSYDYANIDKLLSVGVERVDSKCEDIILSGATGFLGSHILSEYINNKEGKIYCLVRNVKGRVASDRLKERLNFYFGNKYDNFFKNRIIVIDYDNEMDNTTFKRLPTTNVTHFINSLALVKHYGNSEEFYKVNVENVQNMSDFCLSNGIEFIQISTLSVSGDIVEAAKDVDGKNISKKIYTENSFYTGQNLDNIYAYTKFIAEREILERMVSKGLNAKILRMGNLADRYSDGKFQINEKDNAFSARLNSLINIGVIPAEIRKQSLDFTPIDSAAQAVIKCLDINESQIIYHLFNNEKISIEKIVDLLDNMNVELKFGTDEEIKAAIHAAIDKKQEVEGIIVDVTKDANLKYITDVKVTNDITVRILNKYGFKWPPVTDNYLKMVLKRIIEF